MNNLENSRMSNGPEAKVQQIWQEAYAMGANDYENGAFEDILRRLQNKTCSAEEAIREARELLNEKQSYH